MGFFETRRTRLRAEHAHLYPDLPVDVWLNARQVSKVVRHQGARVPCQVYGCARGRVLCDRHFEFRGGTRGRQYHTGIWEQRSFPPAAAKQGAGPAGP